MYAFDYHKPASLQEAADLLASADDGAYLAGGMTLIPTLKQRLAAPSDVIDLAGIDGMAGVTVDGDVMKVGGLTRHAEVAASATIPALADLAGRIGDAHVRNRGTIGGSVANSDPAADYPAAVVALAAEAHTNKRSIPGDAFFTSLFETALQEGEIVTRVDFRVPDAAAYEKFPNPASRYAIVGVLVARYGDAVHVGVTGAGAGAFRATALEAALSADFSPDAIDAVTIDHSDFNTDLYASAEYRGHLLGVLTKRAVARCGQWRYWQLDGPHHQERGDLPAGRRTRTAHWGDEDRRDHTGAARTLGTGSTAARHGRTPAPDARHRGALRRFGGPRFVLHGAWCASIRRAGVA